MKNLNNAWPSEIYKSIKDDMPKPVFDHETKKIKFEVSDKYAQLLSKIISFELQFHLQNCYAMSMSVYENTLLLELNDSFSFSLMDKETLDRIEVYMQNFQRNKVIANCPTFCQLLMERIGDISEQLESGGIVFEYEQGNLTIEEACCAELSV